MALYLEKVESFDDTPRELVPVGNHIARCFSVIDLGTHEESYQGGKPKEKRKFSIGWELNKKKSDGTPFFISKQMAHSGYETSTMFQLLTSWLGGFPEGKFILSEKVINQPCMIQVVHEVSKKNGKTYAGISSVGSMPDGIIAPELVTPITIFSLEPDEFEQDVFDALPEFLRKIIEISPEYKKIQGMPF